MAVGTQGLLETADQALSAKYQSGGNSGGSGNVAGNYSGGGSGSGNYQNYNNSQQQQNYNNSSSSSSSSLFNLQSKFSDQPIDTKEGIQHAYESVSREIKSAAHTIIAIPMKEYHQKGTKGYMKSMVKAVPIAIIRPMIGLTEGVSKTLLGVRNQIDPQKKAEMDNKYKKVVFH
ncbi:hypothetical protein PPL_05228 [Heterostelium album PN500]|uniref:Autophagy-related protein 2 n=1 Tax=Heterostelium pallidum (strain ATCC 26659 / Pp 5 / PN500) TaxID=670386 RepID=D3B9T1_HETP5|nr:hypothetical protein PPL_05228 [Heterostelium album PN500]EFA81993.1 hypothetical protein PPL_05228 [Heterostelium album PN500]|eukprot:XP_020434110.1 hypothetical protein PPL_05228 [Heterostelium album PN500]